ncbi:MAG: YciI family protein [Aquimonas sp.]|nr:YciI family protein [Aquimonas sp.]
MWYLIIGCDAPDSLSLRLQTRAAHIERLNTLRNEGRLKLAGPLPAIDAEDPGEAGFVGSAIVAEFEDFEAARAWAQADPYFEAGVYESVQVLPFRPVMP